MSKFIIHSRHMDRRNLHNFLHLLCKILQTVLYKLNVYIQPLNKKADEMRHCYITKENIYDRGHFLEYHLGIVSTQILFANRNGSEQKIFISQFTF